MAAQYYGVLVGVITFFIFIVSAMLHVSISSKNHLETSMGNILFWSFLNSILFVSIVSLF